jgi:hypothetical protein
MRSIFRLSSGSENKRRIKNFRDGGGCRIKSGNDGLSSLAMTVLFSLTC